MNIKDLMTRAESPFPWHIKGDVIYDAFEDIVGHVAGEDAKLIVALVNREYHQMTFDELDDSHPDPFGELVGPPFNEDFDTADDIATAGALFQRLVEEREDG